MYSLSCEYCVNVIKGEKRLTFNQKEGEGHGSLYIKQQQRNIPTHVSNVKSQLTVEYQNNFTDHSYIIGKPWTLKL